MRYLIENARERKLDRVAVGYTVAAWAVIQAASVGASAFNWPAWVLQAAIVTGVVGLPAALVGAWAWGIRDNTLGQGLRPSRADWHMLGLIMLFLIVAGAAFVWTFWPRPTTANAARAASSAAYNSIAVLPFANTGGDPKQKYFSEGISEELIGRLARNPALHVAARTSSFFFEGKNEDIRAIAQKLNVRTVLEGAVRSENGRVRIEADLIDADSGYQLWAQSYDRALSDILAVQSDIARSITQALAPHLATGHVKVNLPAPVQIDPQVYRDYLQAQFYFDQRLSEGQTPASLDAVAKAIALLRSVTARAPDFADGQAGLASALYLSGGDEAEAHKALTHALALDAENPDALTTAIGLATHAWNWDDLLQDALVLKRTGAHSAKGVVGLAITYDNFGLTEAALAKYGELTHLDPFSYFGWAGVARTNFVLARYADVITSADAALAIHPGDPVVSEYKCVSLASLKRIPEARAILNMLSQPGIPVPLATHCKFFVLLNSEGPKAAVSFLDGVLSKNPDASGGAGDTGFMLSHAPGAFDQAMAWYEKAFNPGNWGFNFYPGESPPTAFFESPRWIALTQRPEYKRWQAARTSAAKLLLNTDAD